MLQQKFVMANTLATKRGADDPATFSDANKRTCSGWETTESLISGTCCELRPEVADKLSKSVVSLALSNGDYAVYPPFIVIKLYVSVSIDHGVLFASSGIAVECQMSVTKFLTSSSLVRALKNATALRDARRGHDALKIEVRHEGNVLLGRLEEYDLDHEIAVVSVRTLRNVYHVCLRHVMDFPLHSEVVAIGRHVSGNLVIKSGRLTVCSWASQSEDSEYLMFSTCEYSEDLHGGALFDIDGNFVGMNLFSDVGGSIFLPRSIIRERLEHLRTHQQRRVFIQLVKTVRDKEPGVGDKHNLSGDVHVLK
ncbi:hypothetical protein EJB05_42637 [Eragrostis curvula]|uniref:Uncharacterized protein n=1 Tax=Eragrostis curvula TaxID=38414 RepID=A0A5J9TCQ2_9POAL|nr:hypothetical protein EJB05_42637 [Eragrostis curvula]